ncbi:hypothetical protein [Amycolatopsis sp. NPDC059021]|uniref:hypothetical protein n=1 Tax=Amycolatopsis sp. NPDC059021 TaxID=3346704 RepID=UPI00366C7DCB
MKSARISRREAGASFEGDGAGEAGFYPDGLTESAVDALIADVDRELTEAGLLASVRVERSFTDPRRAHRSRRRVGRSVLRSLPIRLDVTAAAEGEAA